MSLFNSLGSNYSFATVRRSLLPVPRKSADILRQKLQEQYAASQVFLTYKGREAITQILRQLQLPVGSGVAINGYTCYVVYAAVVAAGHKPYLLDIGRDSLNFSVDTLRTTLKREHQIAAVIIQNTLGIPAPVDGIVELCNQYKIPLIEDLAHSAGMTYANGKLAGTIGQAAALSFSQDKIIDAVSGGAAVLFQPKAFEPNYIFVGGWQRWQAFWYPLNSWIIRHTHSIGIGKVWLKLLRLLRLTPNQMAGDPRAVRRLPNHTAGLALAGFENLATSNAHRQKIAAIYCQELPGSVRLPHDEHAVYIRFPLIVDNPRGLEEYLKQHHIHISQPWYGAVIDPARYLSQTDYASGLCPQAEYMAEHIINLPTHVNINEQQALGLAQNINQWLSMREGGK